MNKSLRLLSLTILIALGGCGGGTNGGGDDPDGHAIPVPSRATFAAVNNSFATAAALEKDAVVLLVPDNADLSSWETKVWVDTAADEGYRMQIMSATSFLALGPTASTKIRALVMPDSAFVSASDAVIAAVTQFARGGGSLMLVYDAGILTSDGFFAADKSRLSGLAGVNYGLYDTLWDRFVGIGGIVASDKQLRALSIPPGKSLPYTGPALVNSSTTLLQSKIASVAEMTPGLAGASPSPTLRYLPADATDPGGQRRARAFTRVRPGSQADEPGKQGIQRARSIMFANPSPDQSAFRLGQAVATHSSALESLATAVSSKLSMAPLSQAVAGNGLEIVSGYNYSHLDYYSFVTTGPYDGQVLVASPDFGVVAGLRKEGIGNVLFVNTPLGYFKAVGTDSALIHGFLNYFAGTVADLPKMSTQPRGIGSMVYNWHVDDGDDLMLDAKALLNNGKVFNRGPFSVHFTSGPDTRVIGDGKGQNLANNPAGRALVRRIGNLGEYAGKLPVQHELGPHGGWDHDVYGIGANEENSDQYLPFLINNFNDINSILGRKVTEYSAPQGNNPLWALTWMQNQGVVGHYYVGDVGAGPVRAYRDGIMQHPKMWAFPVSPFGISATFEEFEERGLRPAAILDWLAKLQDFVVENRTNRMFYNHPPGALTYLNTVVIPMLDRADKLKSQGKFQWLTMTQLGDFLTRRNETSWTVTSAAGVSTFTANHAKNLNNITWLVPRARYAKPAVKSGSATIGQDASFWIITAGNGKSIRITAKEIGS